MTDSRRLDGFTLFEIGFVIAILALAGGVAAVLLGGALDGLSRGRRHAQPPPRAGTISPERHRATNVTASR